MVDKLGNVRYAISDRRRVTDDTPVGGEYAATLYGGGGEGGGRGKVGLADGGDAITVPYGPTTARGAHRGRTPTLDLVLLVPLSDGVPLNTSDVRWDRDLGAHSWCVCGWLAVWEEVVTYDGLIHTFGE